MARAAVALGVLLLALVPAAHAQATYDPLDLTVTIYLAGGKLVESPTAPASVYFPATDPTPGAPPPRLDHALALDTPFALVGGVDVVLKVAADKPVLAPTGGLQISLLSNGAAPDVRRVIASANVTFDKPALAPGDAATLRATLKTNGTSVRAGDTLTLRVDVTLPALAPEALKLFYGDSTARFIHAIVPSLADLGLDLDGVTHGGLEASDAAPAGHVLVVGSVGHDSAAVSPAPRTDQPVFLVLRSTETGDDAHKHDSLRAETRRALAHTFVVGPRVLLVHPGTATVTTLPPPGPYTLHCQTNCPAAFSSTIEFANVAPPSSMPTGPTIVDAPNDVLIPPPPATNGIPTSKDDAPAAKKGIPDVGLALATGAVVLAALRRK